MATARDRNSSDLPEVQKRPLELPTKEKERSEVKRIDSIAIELQKLIPESPKQRRDRSRKLAKMTALVQEMSSLQAKGETFSPQVRKSVFGN